MATELFNPQIETPTPESVITPALVDGILKEANISWKVDHYNVKSGTKLGDNFMSIIYSVSITCKSENGEEARTLELMVKTMPKIKSRISMVKDAQAFFKEAKMYQKVFPTFLDFQTERGLSEPEKAKPWPLFYASLITPEGASDYIALQDLRAKGFEMANRRTGLGLEEAKLVAKALGAFHGISYAKYEGSYEQMMAEFPYLKEEMYRPSAHAHQHWLLVTLKECAKIIEEKGLKYEVYAKEIERISADSYLDRMRHLILHPSQVAVITHGDCWTNNMLFRYDSSTKTPVELKFIDFQMSRVGSRCMDLGYFMYTSPKIHILNEKEIEILQVYYDEFQFTAKSLGYFNHAHTFEELLKEYDEYRLYSLSMGCLLAPFISSESGDMPQFEERSEDRVEEVDFEKFMNEWRGYLSKEPATFDKLLNFAKFHAPRISLKPL